LFPYECKSHECEDTPHGVIVEGHVEGSHHVKGFLGEDGAKTPYQQDKEALEIHLYL
jgi:hypothetical protein